MAKEIKFNIRLNVDGKEQMATATTSILEISDAVNTCRKNARHCKGNQAPYEVRHPKFIPSSLSSSVHSYKIKATKANMPTYTEISTKPNKKNAMETKHAIKHRHPHKVCASPFKTLCLSSSPVTLAEILMSMGFLSSIFL